MNYYYDVILNFNLEELWNFYEWEKEDDFTFVKKIPLFRVSFETICDFLRYQIQLDADFVEKIKNKTVTKNKNEDFQSAFLMSDGKNSLAVLLDCQNRVLALSHLSVDDENNLNEFMYTVKEKEIPYETLEKRPKRCGYRQEEKMKRLISVELDTLKQENNLLKMKYIYLEWFNEESDDIYEMYQKMKEALQGPLDSVMSQIYYFIRLSYHQV